MAGPLNLISSYNFVEKDPSVAKFQALRAKQKVTDKQLAMIAKLALSTVSNLFGGKTVKPVHLTLEKLAQAMNARFELVQDEMPDYEKILPKALELYQEHQEKLRRARNRTTKKPAKKRNGSK